MNNFELGEGELFGIFPDGREVSLGKVQGGIMNADLSQGKDMTASESFGFITNLMDDVFSFEAELDYETFVYDERYCNNNWRKMHGLPMIRWKTLMKARSEYIRKKVDKMMEGLYER